MNHRKPDPFAKTVKIPVRIKDGKVEFIYGGALPELKKGKNSERSTRGYVPFGSNEGP